jgi:hypothetical protein
LALVAVAAAPAPAVAAKKKVKKVSTTFQGTVKSVASSTGVVVLNVTGTTVYGNKARGKSWRFNVRRARLEVGDVNQDGKFDLADVAAGHFVSVVAKVPKKGKLPRTIRGQEFKALSALITLPTAPPTGPILPTGG